MAKTSRREPVRHTAATVVNTGQVTLFALSAVLLIVGLVTVPLIVAQVTVAVVLSFFAVFVGLMKMGLWHASTRHTYLDYDIPSVDDPTLPHYLVLVPMFREPDMIAPMMSGMAGLEYPKDRLRVKLLVESRDRDPSTRAAIDAVDVPSFVDIVEVPDVKPYGKQRALNYGAHVALEESRAMSRRDRAARLCVVYDAEDRPEPDQLRKAVGMFRGYDRVDSTVVCLQAQLAFSNQTSTWVSRLMWAEYLIHFTWVLPGMAKLGLIPPLGGTSNHFRLEMLTRVSIEEADLPPGVEWVGIWDMFNVTEDADLAGALALHGFKIAMLDSVTQEIATTKVSTLIGQKSRWLKGYIQTGLIFTRNPIRTMQHMGFVRWMVYVLFLIGTPLSIGLAAFSWALTYLYFATRSPVIEALFPSLLLYLGVLLLVFGNLVLFLQHVAIATKHEGYSTVKYMVVVLAGIWPMLAVLSLVKACYELANPRMRHFWDKTEHGHDLHTLDQAVGSLRSVSPGVGEPAARAAEHPDVVAVPISAEEQVGQDRTA
ncbi:glycosyltransferase [Mycobacterium sp. ITM-2016-00317]|uniref:glycosyltransferase n=1 Tax=Mycobacterium sp. ITM-2016-00317 TaxID=2099694 RepID=UPI00287F685A|nr:glycosyltransferase [Mycobacterium sp. ITM-2016-00317]WNG86271.1 glycosyltransferase [Mycobacterium sp. ITM-2016-00317]